MSILQLFEIYTNYISLFGVVHFMSSYFEEINFWSHLGKEWSKNPQLFDINSFHGRIEPIKSKNERSSKVTFTTWPGRSTQTFHEHPQTPNPHTPWQSIHKSLGCTLLHPSPKSVHLWGVRRHRTGWRLAGVPLRSTLQTVEVALFRCMFQAAVIFVTHKNMMRIPTPTAWTPPWYATIPNLLFLHFVSVLLKI